MPIENASSIGELNPAYPTSSDPVKQGDDHIRLLKAVLKNTFANLEGQVTASHNELNKLDGVTASTAEINTLDGLTTTTTELNHLNGAGVKKAEFQILNGATISTAELNRLKGVTRDLDPLIDDLKDHMDEADTKYAPAVSGVPAGAIMDFAMKTPPTGWLVCDGSAKSRTTYADLFAAIGTQHGAGNGTTTFNVPDYRGEFRRGWDAGRGVDSGRAFGSFQADQLKSHTHVIPKYEYQWSNKGGSSNQAYRPAGNTTTGGTGGNETRPRNKAVLVCIKT